MSDRYESRFEVWSKVENEGGIYAALDYGLKASDLPDVDTELQEAWQKLDGAFKAMQPLIRIVEKMLSDAYEAALDAEE